MAKIFLDPNETFTLSSGNAQVFGKGGGSEKVILQPGVSNVTIAATVENVEFALASNDLQFQRQGNRLLVLHNGQPLASVGVQDDTDGTNLKFANTAQPVVATIGATGLLIGETAIPSEAPTTVNVTGGSTNNPGGGQIAVSSAQNGQTLTNPATSNETYTFAAGNYTVTIAGFNAGDKLQFPTNDISVINDNFNDGQLQIEWAANAQVIAVTLTGIAPANDATIFGVSSFNAAFANGLGAAP